MQRMSDQRSDQSSCLKHAPDIRITTVKLKTILNYMGGFPYHKYFTYHQCLYFIRKTNLEQNCHCPHF